MNSKKSYLSLIVANLRRRGAARRFWGQKFGNKNAIKTKLQNTHPKNWPHLCSNGAVPAVFEPSAALFAKKRLATMVQSFFVQFN